jgi:N-acetyl-anhydromuramyl-L-alanine amidase AmpD
MYAYVDSDPVNGEDPGGFFDWERAASCYLQPFHAAREKCKNDQSTLANKMSVPGISNVACSGGAIRRARSQTHRAMATSAPQIPNAE